MAGTLTAYKDFTILATVNGTANDTFVDVEGNKSDTAATGAVGTTKSSMAYIKQIVTQLLLTDASATSLLADIGDASGATLGSLYGILGNPATTFTVQIAALTTELAKVPKSDSTVTFNATALASVKAQVTAALVTDNKLDKLIVAAEGAGAYPASVIDNSILALILSKVANGDTSSYNNTTDSLEAISDKITVVDALFDVPTADSTDNAASRDVIGNKADAAATGAVTATDTIMAYIKQLVTSAIANDTKFLAGVPQTVSVTTVDGSATAWTQAAHRLFTITGLVKVKVIGLVTESLTGAATLAVGIAGDTGCFIEALADAGAECLAGDMIHNYSTGISTALPVPEQGWKYAYNTDIDLLIGSANVTNGQITFFCEWIPISAGATVVAAVWD